MKFYFEVHATLTPDINCTHFYMKFVPEYNTNDMANGTNNSLMVAFAIVRDIIFGIITSKVIHQVGNT